MIIPTRNILTTNAPKTYLSNTEVAGTTIFRLRNTIGFGSGWAIQLGETGQEQSEVLVLSGNPGAGTLGTSTAVSRFEHPSDTPVYAIKYNQVVFERSTAGTAGTATPMTNGTVTIQADSNFTQFDDTSGSSTYAYKTYFRNSSLAINSTESDWITSAGFSFYSLGKIRQRIKNKLWNSSYLQEDTVIDDWINEWKDKMTNAVITVNEDYALGTVNIAFGTNGLGTITTGDFSQLRDVLVHNGTSTHRSTKMNINDYNPNTIYSSTNPHHYFQGDSVIGFVPREAGTAELAFYRFGTTMVNDTDELPQPMKSYTDSFVNYSLAQALFMDGKTDEYDRKLGEAMNSRNDFVNEIVPRDKTGPTMIDVVEPISGE